MITEELFCPLTGDRPAVELVPVGSEWVVCGRRGTITRRTRGWVAYRRDDELRAGRSSWGCTLAEFVQGGHRRVG